MSLFIGKRNIDLSGKHKSKLLVGYAAEKLLSSAASWVRRGAQVPTTQQLFAMNLEQLLAERESAGFPYPKRDLANALGKPQSMISRWLQGDNLPEGKNLDEIAAFFKVSVERLFADQDAVPQDRATRLEVVRQIHDTLRLSPDEIRELAEMREISLSMRARRKRIAEPQADVQKKKPESP